jgi:hypothetical protein
MVTCWHCLTFESRFSLGADSIPRLEVSKPCAVTLKGKIGKISAPFGKAARFPYEEKGEILQKATDSSVRRGGRGLGACPSNANSRLRDMTIVVYNLH